MHAPTRFIAVAIGTALSVAAVAPAATADDVTVRKGDFIAGASDTRATGHLYFTEDRLVLNTEGSTSTDKIAEYLSYDKLLSLVGEPALEFDQTYGTTPPGFQLVVDLDADGNTDGILVGEPKFYGDRWWANNTLNRFLDGKTAPPAADGYQHSGPLSDWRLAYPTAKVTAIGFSLGSGVFAGGELTKITTALDTFTFTGKDKPPVIVPPTEPEPTEPPVTTPPITPAPTTPAPTPPAPRKVTPGISATALNANVRSIRFKIASPRLQAGTVASPKTRLYQVQVRVLKKDSGYRILSRGSVGPGRTDVYYRKFVKAKRDVMVRVVAKNTRTGQYTTVLAKKRVRR